MKFSAQEEFGLRCLLCLARVGLDHSLTIPEIASMEGMTNSHVAKILAILRKNGYINSTRGQLGGYRLARPAGEIVLKDVMEDLGGRLFGDKFCERHRGLHCTCVHESDCDLRPLWTSIQHAVEELTSRYTLADLIDRKIEEPLVSLGRTIAKRPETAPNPPVKA